ncbi:phosphoglycolate phosphatase [Methylothermus subterraneus]
MNRLRCILFDLDGTLLDTLPDLAFALNTLLSEEGRRPLPLAAIRPAVSHGAKALVRLGFGEVQDEAVVHRRVNRLLAVYRQHLADRTRLFAGMDEVLERIEAQGKKWGVVTNKRRFLTLPLLERLGLWQRAACVVCGDDTRQGKPHPEPLWLACQIASVEPGACAYIGDAKTDIEAGRRAGMRTLAAGYGYLAPDDRPEDWGADAIVAEPSQLVRWLRDDATLPDRVSAWNA